MLICTVALEHRDLTFFFVAASSNIATFGDENGLEAMMSLLIASKTGSK